MKKKTLIIIVSFVLLLILSLPLLINVLLRIDWFSSIVMGGESGWLSFYGSYLGGILGGLLTLVGVIVTIMYQDRMRTRESSEKQKVGVKILDNLIDDFYLSVYVILQALNEEEVNYNDMRDRIIANSDRIDKYQENLETVPWDIIPHNFFQEFLMIKTNGKIIGELFAEEFLQNSSSREEIIETLNEVDFKEFLKMVIDSHLAFKEHSLYMESLQKELERGGY